MTKIKEQLNQPSPLDILPDRATDEGLKALLDRQASFTRRLNLEQERRADLEAQLSTAHHVSRLDEFADALLDDAEVSFGQAQLMTPDLATVQQNIEGLQRAIKRGNDELLTYECELDGAACRAVASLHRRNVRDTLNCFLRLHRSSVQQAGLHEALHRRGFQRTSALRPIYHHDFTGGFKDPNSWLSMTFREAVEWKFISEDERMSLLQGRVAELDLNA